MHKSNLNTTYFSFVLGRFLQTIKAGINSFKYKKRIKLIDIMINHLICLMLVGMYFPLTPTWATVHCISDIIILRVKKIYKMLCSLQHRQTIINSTMFKYFYEYRMHYEQISLKVQNNGCLALIIINLLATPYFNAYHNQAGGTWSVDYKWCFILLTLSTQTCSQAYTDLFRDSQ